jgi:long-chain acyl-CoA synthetase
LPNFPEQFFATVRRFPDRLAVSVRHDQGVERFTYRELHALSLRGAHFLRLAGIRAGDRCAILAENSAHWCAVYLAILEAGAIAVPFDTAYTATQVSTLLRDCGATALFTSRRFHHTAREAAGDAGCRVALLEEALAAEQHDAPSCPATLTDPAVILYTSGTTADPKGVVLTHGNLLAEKDAAFAIIAVRETDAVIGVLPLFHALAQLANLLLPFSAGAHVVFLDTPNSAALLRALDEEGITIFVCVPQFFYLIHQRVMAEVSKRGALARMVFRGLLRLNRALRRGGVNLGPFLFRRVHRTLGRRMRLLITGGSKFDEGIGGDLVNLGFTIQQAYGLTETSGAATVTRPGEPIHTVGTPLPGVEIRIQAQAGGDDGEILIRGAIVMSGYWNRPDATSQVLRDGWLHTGDLGRLDAQGRLTITGRSKEVIVLSSGKNIYPEELETHYRQSPFIAELCVLGVSSPGAPTSERLHALVVPARDVLRDKKIVNTVELIRFELEGLSVLLPAHKRVLGFDVTMEALPRTTTGKLKRHEIQKRYVGGARIAIRDAGPADPPDTHVARIVALVQHAMRPGVIVRPDSNLELDLGLDSMERVELLAALELRFGVRVSEDVAQSALLVRDVAEAFRGATEAAEGRELPWDTLLALADPPPSLRALLRPRTLAAAILFAVLRGLSAVLPRVDVAGLEHLPRRGPYIISPNHQSYLDPFMVMRAIPFGVFRQLFFVGAAEYFETPLTAWLARVMNVVPVDPDANLVPAMQAGAYGLRHGKILVLFPEGERSIDGTVRKFKKGAAILSHHLDVPIVPVAIDGVFEIWPRNRRLHWRRLLPWSAHRVRVRFGAPIVPGRLSYAEQTARLRGSVEQMWLLLSARRLHGFHGGSAEAGGDQRGAELR